MGMRHGRAALLAGALAIVPTSGAAAPPTPSEPDEETKPASRPVDPGVAIGPPIAYATRPASVPQGSACSARAPLCVHTSSGRDGAPALATLGAFERGWQIVTGALGLPPPDLDPRTLAY